MEVPEIHLFPEGSRKILIERELRLLNSCAVEKGKKAEGKEESREANRENSMSRSKVILEYVGSGDADEFDMSTSY